MLGASAVFRHLDYLCGVHWKRVAQQHVWRHFMVWKAVTSSFLTCSCTSPNVWKAKNTRCYLHIQKITQTLSYYYLRSISHPIGVGFPQQFTVYLHRLLGSSCLAHLLRQVKPWQSSKRLCRRCWKPWEVPSSGKRTKHGDGMWTNRGEIGDGSGLFLKIDGLFVCLFVCLFFPWKLRALP